MRNALRALLSAFATNTKSQAPTAAHPRRSLDTDPASATAILREHWNRQQNTLRSDGADAQEVAAFEARHALAMPAEFRHYVLALNGIWEDDPDDWSNVDDEGFTFDPLASLAAAEPDDRYFVFARNALFLSEYAICLDPASPRHGEVVLVCHRLHELAADFTEFVHLYVADDDALVTGKGGPPIADSRR